MTATLVERAFRRSRVRQRVLLALARSREAYVAQLAEDAGLDAQRVRFALVGALPRYRHDLSLVALGLAMVVERAGERVVVVTPAGERVADAVREASFSP